MPIAKDRILFEDQWLLAVTKLSGELVVRGKGRMDKLPLFDFLKKDYPGLHVIHRLDFETSGVVVFAKSKTVLAKILEKKFAGWHKHYIAIVLGTVAKKEGLVDFRLPARSSDGKVPAVTHYKVAEPLGPVTIVELNFERGQKHQIRKHMAMIHHPLILDQVYGNFKANKEFEKFLRLKRFFLHATSITFPHPVTEKETTITSPVPKAFLATVKKLKG